MTDHPEPLTPADCDLRGYDFMPLFGNKLFGSKLYGKALRNPRAGLAAIKLWWVAWQQCPAGSLPDDDDDLAMLSDFGMDVKGWLKVREVALHGFIKCSDGRLYHPMLCTEAADAFERRRKERERKAKMRAAKIGTSPVSGSGSPEDVPRDNPGTERGTDEGRDADVRADRTGQDRTEERKIPTTSDAPAVASPSDAPIDVRTELWSAGLSRLMAVTGLPAAKARIRMGQLLRDSGDQCAPLLAALHDCPNTQDPNAWLTKAAQGIKARATNKSTIAQIRDDWSLPSIADAALMDDMDDLPRRLQ